MYYVDTPSSSFETPINKSHETPKTHKDDKSEQHESTTTSKQRNLDEDEDEFDGQSVTTASTKHSKWFFL